MLTDLLIAFFGTAIAITLVTLWVAAIFVPIMYGVCRYDKRKRERND
jgi:hypothetical protein